MSVLSETVLFSSYKPLNFGFLSLMAVFLCGVYCTIKQRKSQVNGVKYHVAVIRDNSGSWTGGMPAERVYLVVPVALSWNENRQRSIVNIPV